MKINKKQKLLIIFLVPLSLFFLFYYLAYYLNGECNPFDEDFGFTAYIWSIYILIVLIFEIIILRNPKKDKT